MKKLLIATAVASALLAGTALAAQSNAQAKNPSKVYVGGDAGVAIPAQKGFGDELNTGFDIGGHAGYRVNKNVRVEGDITYIRNSFTDATAQSVNYSSLKNNQLFFMVNGYYDLTTNYQVVPFVGVGAGLLHEWGTGTKAIATAPDTASTNAFAFQGLAGLSYKINSSMDVNVTYHLMSWTGSAGFQNIINGGVNYYF
ncbi:MAG: porin family protein [Gammaproteobacteria bacterium]|nr:porin family protein [Gammaproteobacteria bacterium]